MIIIIDGDARRRPRTTAILEQAGHKVQGEAPGEEALALAQEADLIILAFRGDAGEPPDLHRRLLGSRGSPPLLLLCEKGRELPSGVRDMAAAVLKEPVDSSALTACAGALVRAHRAERRSALDAEALEEAQKDLAQFAFAASHDLKGQIRTIASFTGLLQRRYAGHADAEVKEFLRLIEESGARLGGLLNALLEYSRIVELSSQPHSPADSESLLALTILKLNGELTATGAEVTHDQLPLVMGHDGSLCKLFEHLIRNANRFKGSEPPRVHVRARTRDPDAEFSVSDNGLGIEPQYHARIFRPFYRLHGADVPGYGLGLAVCERVVRAHGGRIWVESALGHGSNFLFTLPLASGVNGEGMARV